jgi:amino acid transporter
MLSIYTDESFMSGYSRTNFTVELITLVTSFTKLICHCTVCIFLFFLFLIVFPRCILCEYFRRSVIFTVINLTKRKRKEKRKRVDVAKLVFIFLFIYNLWIRIYLINLVHLRPLFLRFAWIMFVACKIKQVEQHKIYDRRGKDQVAATFGRDPLTQARSDLCRL